MKDAFGGRVSLGPGGGGGGWSALCLTVTGSEAVSVLPRESVTRSPTTTTPAVP